MSDFSFQEELFVGEQHKRIDLTSDIRQQEKLFTQLLILLLLSEKGIPKYPSPKEGQAEVSANIPSCKGPASMRQTNMKVEGNPCKAIFRKRYTTPRNDTLK